MGEANGRPACAVGEEERGEAERRSACLVRRMRSERRSAARGMTGVSWEGRDMTRAVCGGDSSGACEGKACVFHVKHRIRAFQMISCARCKSVDTCCLKRAARLFSAALMILSMDASML